MEDGWGRSESDVQTTSHVIQALVAAGEDKDSDTIKDALDYLKSKQGDDGGFLGVLTTSSAIQAIVVAGKDPLTYTKNGNNPLEYH